MIYFAFLMLRLSLVILQTLHISYNSSVNSITSFSIIKLLASSSCFIELTSVSNKILHRSGTSEHSCLVCSLKRKAFSLPSLNMILAVDSLRCLLSDLGSSFLS